MTSTLILAAGLLANAAALVVLWSGFFTVANTVHAQVQSKIVARLIVMALAACTLAVALFLVGIAPMFLARFFAGVTGLEGLQAYTGVSCVIGVCVTFYAARTPAGRRYAKNGIWGRQ